MSIRKEKEDDSDDGVVPRSILPNRKRDEPRGGRVEIALISTQSKRNRARLVCHLLISRPALSTSFVSGLSINDTLEDVIIISIYIKIDAIKIF